jgi:hypothetical protein
MMDAILDDRSFAEAVTAGYGTGLQALWLRFAQAQSTAQYVFEGSRTAPLPAATER